MVTRVFLAVLGLIILTTVYFKVRKKLFSEKESFFWILAALAIFFLSIFPKIIDQLSSLLGIVYPPSLLFLLALLFVVFLLFRQSQQTAVLNDRLRELSQKVAILEHSLREATVRLEDNGK